MQLDKMKQQATEVADLLKTMTHPERLIVLCQLMDGEMSANQLQLNSTLSQSAFSQHLAILRKNNIVKIRKEAQSVFYSLADPRITALITSFHDIFCDQD
ncbi:ArsR/SmtB family transcription factor [Photobacterium carnosum]|uniref:Transcriptional regulator n=1 Tax=Photobacterium carnosum TaxID=2023717 RepID=A0A2N4UUV3_9GAMM|nr:metalloregulator ArsR/SmtB family transcription factor [Photobacterium carnosum]MCD9539885.1 metalloregulator ArsR/SmtB family transcription factor [Photobacterium carnosum]PLC58804.1 transcriptional regulator [Photobacterium carnosum]